MLLIDAHEDMAWNALTFNRDYRWSAAEIREREADSEVPQYNGTTLLGKADWLQGQVAVIFSTLFVSPAQFAMGSWDRHAYKDSQDAHQYASEQLDYYHRLADQDSQFRLIDVE